MSYIRSQLEFLQAIIIFAADLRIVSGAAGDLEQGLANATQSLGSLRRLLPTLELDGNRRASLEKWIEQSEEDLKALRGPSLRYVADSFAPARKPNQQLPTSNR